MSDVVLVNITEKDRKGKYAVAPWFVFFFHFFGKERQAFPV